MENEKKKVNYNKIPKKKPEPVEVTEPIAEAVSVETPVEEPVKKETLKRGIVNSSCPLNLRSEPKKDAKIVTIMPGESRLSIEGEDGDFYKVKFNSLEGYAMKKFIDVK